MDIEKQLQEIREELRRISALGRPLPALLTREQAAEQLAVSVATLDRMIRRGQIHLAGSSDKRRPRIPASEIHRLSAPRVLQKARGGRKSRVLDVQQEVAKVRAALRQRR